MSRSKNASPAGIILAAGRGTRLGGKVKALLKIGSKTFIEKIISNFQKCKIRNIIVVLGYKAGRVERFLEKKGLACKVSIVINDRYDSEQLVSLKIALKNVPDGCRGVMFTPVDYPLAKLSTYKKLSAAWQKDRDKICLPSYSYRKGHPAIFPKKIFKEILTKRLAGGARSLIKKNPKKVKYVIVADPGTVNDFDSMKDFKRHVFK